MYVDLELSPEMVCRFGPFVSAVIAKLVALGFQAAAKVVAEEGLDAVMAESCDRLELAERCGVSVSVLTRRQ